MPRVPHDPLAGLAPAAIPGRAYEWYELLQLLLHRHEVVCVPILRIRGDERGHEVALPDMQEADARALRQGISWGGALDGNLRRVRT
jgi:hypothetical protein